MRNQFPLLLVFVLGVLVAVQEFVPLDIAKGFKEFALDWTIVIGVFAMALGLWSLTRVSFDLVHSLTFKQRFKRIHQPYGAADTG